MKIDELICPNCKGNDWGHFNDVWWHDDETVRTGKTDAKEDAFLCQKCKSEGKTTIVIRDKKTGTIRIIP